MQEELPQLRTRGHRPQSLRLWHQMIVGERGILVRLGLYHITFIPELRSNRALLTALAERWHSETSSFHLPTGEATVTLEDVWRILRIPIHGELMVYDPAVGRAALHRLFDCGDAELGIQDYEIRWDLLWARHERVVAVICRVIGGLLILDRRGHGFPVGWGRVLEQMVMDGTMFAWGPCMLAMLYYYLHQVVYRGGLPFNTGGALLQIWAYEHISIFWPLVERELIEDMPYVYN